jgi:hypothetical protein
MLPGTKVLVRIFLDPKVSIPTPIAPQSKAKKYVSPTKNGA